MHFEESHLKCQLFDLQPERSFVRRIHIIWQSNAIPPPTNNSKWLVIHSSNKIILQCSTSNGTSILFPKVSYVNDSYTKLNSSLEQWGWYIVRSVLLGCLLEWELYLHETVIENQSFIKDLIHSQQIDKMSNLTIDQKRKYLGFSPAQLNEEYTISTTQQHMNMWCKIYIKNILETFIAWNRGAVYARNHAYMSNTFPQKF